MGNRGVTRGEVTELEEEKGQQLEPCATPAPKDQAEKEEQAEDAQKQRAEWQENCIGSCTPKANIGVLRRK